MLGQQNEKLSSDSASTASTLIPDADDSACGTLDIPLGNLQYGQSRDMYLSCPVPPSELGGVDGLPVHAQLRYSSMHGVTFVVEAQQDIRLPNSIPAAQFAYHQSRAMLCDYLSSLFPRIHGEYKLPARDSRLQKRAQEELEMLVSRIPAKNYGDEYNASLLEDITGQVKLAVERADYLRTWGLHYFLSLWDAHAMQVQNTFKDPGVQVYDKDSPLFCECQKVLTRAFNSLKPPEPSRGRTASVLLMEYYNRSDNPCFSGSSLVTLANGKRMPVSGLRGGMSVETPAGSRRVAVVLKTRVRKVIMCRVRDLLVTPWHPIALPERNGDTDSEDADGGAESSSSLSSPPPPSSSWVFPHEVADKAVRYSGAIYSVLLEPDASPAAHAVRVGGVWGVTLGHGIVDGSQTRDARAHEFLGDYGRIVKALAALGVGHDGVAVAVGVRRSKTCSGRRLEGFRGPSRLGEMREGSAALRT